MTQNQMMMLAILVVYLIINAGIGMYVSKREDKKSSMNFEKKYFIGSRGMSGFVLAMTTVCLQPAKTPRIIASRSRIAIDLFIVSSFINIF